MVTPNRLTALRILIAVISPFVLIWYRSFAIDLIVFIALIVACFTDWWDGHLARTKAMITEVGKIADPIADKLLILGLIFAFSYLGLYGVKWVLPILIREVVVTGTRLNYLRKGRVLPAEWAGKVKVGFQFGSIYATLVFLTLLDSGFFPSQSHPVLIAFRGIHYLGIFLANVVTVLSGIIFFNNLSRT